MEKILIKFHDAFSHFWFNNYNSENETIDLRIIICLINCVAHINNLQKDKINFNLVDTCKTFHQQTKSFIKITK